MIKKRDFSRVTFKVNAAGSWATLVPCDAERIEEIKKACAVIGAASGGRVTFKMVDAEGGTIEQYGAVGYGRHGWYEPRRRGR